MGLDPSLPHSAWKYRERLITQNAREPSACGLQFSENSTDSRRSSTANEEGRESRDTSITSPVQGLITPRPNPSPLRDHIAPYGFGGTSKMGRGS